MSAYALKFWYKEKYCLPSYENPVRRRIWLTKTWLTLEHPLYYLKQCQKLFLKRNKRALVKENECVGYELKQNYPIADPTGDECQIKVWLISCMTIHPPTHDLRNVYRLLQFLYAARISIYGNGTKLQRDVKNFWTNQKHDPIGNEL